MSTKESSSVLSRGQVQSILRAFRKWYPNVFYNDRKTHIKGFEANLVVKENSNKIFHKAYSVPYSLREKVKVELESLVSEVILIPVSHTNIASPIVVVPKKNNTIGICGDLKEKR